MYNTLVYFSQKAIGPIQFSLGLLPSKKKLVLFASMKTI